MRRQALRVALSDKVREDAVTVIDVLKVDAPKSSVIRDIVAAFELKGRTLIVTGATDQNVIKSANNLPGIEVQTAALMNPLEATTASNLIFTQDAIVAIDGLWGSAGGDK